jgi:hypothetical protein
VVEKLDNLEVGCVFVGAIDSWLRVLKNIGCGP